MLDTNDYKPFLLRLCHDITTEVATLRHVHDVRSDVQLRNRKHDNPEQPYPTAPDVYTIYAFSDGVKLVQLNLHQTSHSTFQLTLTDGQHRIITHTGVEQSYRLTPGTAHEKMEMRAALIAAACHQLMQAPKTPR